MTRIISPELGEELKLLYVELPAAYQRAANALRTDGQPLEGEFLARFLEEEGRVDKIVRRIKEIQGGP